LETDESANIMEKMAEFHGQHANNQIFRVFRQYMCMVLEMFIWVVRTASWRLYLQALEIFPRYIFAHDCLNYTRMIPLYLAEMKSLQDTNPDIYDEFLMAPGALTKIPRYPSAA